MSERASAGTRRSGLFGGSFDPVHVAHVALARAALDALDLDDVRWIPAGAPWQKASMRASAEDRAAMVALAIEGEARFVLDRCEVERAGPSYTIDTVREKTAAEPGTRFVLLLGEDQYAGLHTWNGWRELAATVELAVAARIGARPRADAEVETFGRRTIPMPPMDISSTEIRRRVAAGESLAGLVPREVARYIEAKGLYRS